MEKNKKIRELIHHYCGGTYENRKLVADKICKIHDDEAVDYNASSLQLKEKETPTFEEYKKDNFTKRGNIYFSKCHKSGWFIKKEIEKMYKVEYNL